MEYFNGTHLCIFLLPISFAFGMLAELSQALDDDIVTAHFFHKYFQIILRTVVAGQIGIERMTPFPSATK